MAWGPSSKRGKLQKLAVTDLKKAVHGLNATALTVDGLLSEVADLKHTVADLELTVTSLSAGLALAELELRELEFELRCSWFIRFERWLRRLFS